MSGGGFNLFFTDTPAVKNGINCINDDDNGAVDGGGRRRRAARLSTFLCAEVSGMWRASSFDHEDAMNNRDNNEDAAWEPE